MTKTLERFDASDIVVVPFPYANRLAEKHRPALVISNRKLAPFGVIWVAMITSADNASWSCDVAIADLARAGLPAPSVGTAREDRLHRTIADRTPRRKARQGDRKGRGAEAEGVFGSGVRWSGRIRGNAFPTCRRRQIKNKE
jgi:mRNA-degrading endonuclease toxin of MazEF toxin-antitoxin module